MQSLERFLTPDFAEIKEITPTQCEIVLEPLERGYGHTLGNALRRVLLSSIDGAAVTIVRIDGVLHDYAVIDGVQEDVIDILLNLKNLSFRLDEGVEQALVSLDVKGPGELFGSQLNLPHSVELINPETYLATITQDCQLKMELVVKQGVGFETAAERKREKPAEIGELHLDSYYSPIRRVSYQVDSTRQGNRTDLDKLTLHLETNGTISPRDAVCRSALILHRQLSAFVDMKTYEEKTENEYKISIDPIFLRPVEDLELTVRSANCLKNAQIIFIGDLVQKNPAELIKISNFGRKSLLEIQNLLKALDLELGLKVEGWPPPKLRNQG